ncbi:hypothetical protein BpHYR1_019966 [Brachionus plicatilis]|uniref:Uncharacterized protein n=1 Tax=Brachionus plicatilis TaxID=10195 RepID=A0A3M7PKI9_BRAPC|nr:hypothetical protein BpHYR1_019966 [Brachionus plicatilis]
MTKNIYKKNNNIKLNQKKIKKSKKLFHNTNQKQLNCILMIYSLKYSILHIIFQNNCHSKGVMG